MSDIGDFEEALFAYGEAAQSRDGAAIRAARLKCLALFNDEPVTVYTFGAPPPIVRPVPQTHTRYFTRREIIHLDGNPRNNDLSNVVETYGPIEKVEG